MWRRGLLFRPLAHSAVVVLSVLAILFGGLFKGSQINAQDLSTPASEAVLVSSNTSETVVPQDRPRSEIVDYTIVSGDTLSKIAQKYNVSVQSIEWANSLSDSDSLTVGDSIKIPPVSGIIYTVKSGDTVEKIAKKYKADPQTIIDYPFNYIDDSLALKIGQVLVVPNGVQPDAPAPVPQSSYLADKNSASNNNPVSSVRGSGAFRWPTPGLITQYSSWWHPGAIDIGTPVGTPVVASDDGRVVASLKEWAGYGWHVIVDHGNGLTSLYAHLSAIYVSTGQSVSKGQIVGAVGLTGRTTGPHLHFETRRGGVPVNPLSLLP